MSWRKIEKVWDEVRAAQEPKRNLSKQPKKSREVNLTTTDIFQETISIAFDNERLIEDYREAVSFINDFVVGLRNRMMALEGANAEFWNEKSDDLVRQKKSIDKARESLGVSYEDLGMDYDSGDIIEAIKIYATLRGTAEEMQDMLDELQNSVKNLG